MRGVTLSTLRDATDSVLTCICGGVADHSLHAIRSMQAMANFFVVHEARQNTQHFASEQAREAAYSAYQEEESSSGIVLSSSQWNSDEYNEISHVEEISEE